MRIVIRKSERRLDLLDGDAVKGTYSIALGNAPDGAKKAEGDGRTPEGEYYVFAKNSQSKFHLSLALSYPSVQDAEQSLAEEWITHAEFETINDAAAAGKRPPQYTAAGGEIYIHGGGSNDDWTQGCVAVGNQEMEAIFAAAYIGTVVTILP